MSIEYVGFHGSNYENTESILKESFRESTSEDEWLGYGVYFFVDGISDPIVSATEWAKNEAHSRGGYLYNKYAVFKSNVYCEKVLDTTTKEGLITFNKMRNFLIQKHDDCFERNRDFRHDNRIMWNLIAQTMRLDVVVHNLYIQNKVQRIKKIKSNVPNCTVMCVKVPSSIKHESIEVVCTGDVR